MDLLDYFYELRPRNDLYHPRKLQLPEQGSFRLYGARGTGKTARILEWLRNLPPESWLYLDAQDPIFATEDTDASTLERYLVQEGIETLVIDHWYEGFLDRLPQARRLVLVSRIASAKIKLPAYELFPLDYEEFLGLDRSHSPSATFNRYLRAGTLPSVARSPVGSAPLKLRELFYEKFDEQESRLLLILAKFQGRRVTTHQIYTHAREYFRISKDWTYATIKRWIEERVIFLLDDLRRGSGKKLIVYDFVLTRYLHKLQPFTVTFDSMVALALIKHGLPFKSVGNLGYLLEKERRLVVPAPFEGEEQFWRKAQSRYGAFRAGGAEKIVVVTVSNLFEFDIGDLHFEALPFYEWSILND